ncbi:hypothetical protein [Marinobacter salicampi]|uniref:hypothetical protein n=1 Tax=Marinobacter salicampi TaxID=435907 RepID=UPI00140A0F41|nr:hypothetical protein [Marinobacter salicampi]
MKKNTTVSRLLSQYVGNSQQKVVALMLGDGINAIPDDVASSKLRYARVGTGKDHDLTDLVDADCVIIDFFTTDSRAIAALKAFLYSIQDNKDYLIITEASDIFGSEIVELLESFRPRLIVTSDRMGKCA